jgi:RNA recognition motif. (a.k.a. RRM, RBD, or RNP domain)
MIRHRSATAQNDKTSSSSDEEDAFSLLSRKKKRPKIPENQKTTETPIASSTSSPVVPHKHEVSLLLPAVSATSSMKRHHGILSDTRKSRMDALLMELAAEKHKARSEPPRHFVPDKKGSFVEPGEEHLTTNIFVGNLHPTITEEDMAEVFRQFGENIFGGWMFCQALLFGAMERRAELTFPL